MAETLWKSQAHIPGRVFRHIRASVASLFNIHSFPFAMVSPFLSLPNLFLDYFTASLKPNILRSKAIQGHWTVIDLHLSLRPFDEEVLQVIPAILFWEIAPVMGTPGLFSLQGRRSDHL